MKTKYHQNKCEIQIFEIHQTSSKLVEVDIFPFKISKDLIYNLYILLSDYTIPVCRDRLSSLGRWGKIWIPPETGDLRALCRSDWMMLWIRSAVPVWCPWSLWLRSGSRLRWWFCSPRWPTAPSLRATSPWCTACICFRRRRTLGFAGWFSPALPDVVWIEIQPLRILADGWVVLRESPTDMINLIIHSMLKIILSWASFRCN